MNNNRSLSIPSQYIIYIITIRIQHERIYINSSGKTWVDPGRFISYLRVKNEFAQEEITERKVDQFKISGESTIAPQKPVNVTRVGVFTRGDGKGIELILFFILNFDQIVSVIFTFYNFIQSTFHLRPFILSFFLSLAYSHTYDSWRVITMGIFFSVVTLST